MTPGKIDLKKTCEEISNLIVGNRPTFLNRRFTGIRPYFKSSYDPHKIKKIAKALLKALDRIDILERRSKKWVWLKKKKNWEKQLEWLQKN